MIERKNLPRFKEKPFRKGTNYLAVNKLTGKDLYYSKKEIGER
jgi:hypothetical protein